MQKHAISSTRADQTSQVCEAPRSGLHLTGMASGLTSKALLHETPEECRHPYRECQTFYHFTTTGVTSENVLVQSHISDREDFSTSFEAEITIFADLVKVDVDCQATRRGGGQRSIISDFSAQSRKRMLERLAMLRDTSGGFFVTLTYPGRFAWSPEECKVHLANFRKALLRRFPGCGAFWRMEIKPRQSGESQGELVPHFHLLIFGVNPPSLAYMRRWINVTWSRVAAYPDSPPQKLRTQCDEITSRRHAAAYASKYAAKLEDCNKELFQSENSQSWGRHWGVFGALDFSPVMVVTLPGSALVRFKRLVRGWLKSRGSNYYKRLARIRQDFGFSAFGLGDLSPGSSGDMFGGTIARMILASGE